MSSSKEVVSVPISKIDVSKNIRGPEVCGWSHVGDLARSIKELGQIQPVLLVDRGEDHSPRYECISGHLRIEACRMNDASSVRAVIVRSKDASAAKRAAMRLAENVARVQLSPLEEARAYSDMLSDGSSVRDVAMRTGISDARIKDRLKLLRLPEDVRDKVLSGEIGSVAARALARAPAVAGQIETDGKTAIEIAHEVTRKARKPKQIGVDGTIEKVSGSGRRREMRSKPEIREALAEVRAYLPGISSDAELAEKRAMCSALEWVLCEREVL